MKTALREVVTRTAARGGKVLIPAFALERAQTVVYLLYQLREEGAIPPVPVYVDSPLTADVTEVFRDNPEHFDPPARAFWQHLGDVAGFHAVTDVEDSKALQYLHEPAIIIAGSGMCEAGRIVHHLRNNLEDERNTVLLVGFQARHTLGRQLLERRPEVRIFGLEIPVEAEIAEVPAFSSHADQNDLLAFARACRPTLERLFLVHGEEPQALALAQRLQEEGFERVAVPHAGSFYDL
jgi:metallo-beta-lactamase family protein